MCAPLRAAVRVPLRNPLTSRRHKCDSTEQMKTDGCTDSLAMYGQVAAWQNAIQVKAAFATCRACFPPAFAAKDPALSSY